MAIAVRRTLYLLSGTLKGIFFVLLVIIVLGIILYTQKLVQDLRQEVRDIVESRIEIYQKIVMDAEAEEGLSWFFENVVQRFNFPRILTGPGGEPTSWKGINVPEDDHSPEAIRKVRAIMRRMSQENKPVAITYEGQVLSYLYYGDSKLITQLVYFPYITLSALGLLVLAAFFGFNSIKKSEQRYIWVGMAKETAHQLGTPTSSMMGWIELLRLHVRNPEKVKQITDDMLADVRRLETVAARFSQIGSEAALKEQKLDDVLKDVISYFERRLPQMGKSIQITYEPSELPPIAINRDLFEWALENLIKNSLDAIKNKKGFIKISTGLQQETNNVYIDIQDNGIGIHNKKRHDIFKAGYSTKKRGWGLGLNFTKRIVEDYHKGNVFIKETQPGKGTTMRILL